MTGELRSRGKADRVREHLANESTYLSWMQSAIALMALSVVIVRFRLFRSLPQSSTPVGWSLAMTLAIASLITIGLATQHYFAVRRDIDDDVYQPGDRWVILAILVGVLLAVGVVYYVLLSARH